MVNANEALLRSRYAHSGMGTCDDERHRYAAMKGGEGAVLARGHRDSLPDVASTTNLPRYRGHLRRS